MNYPRSYHTKGWAQIQEICYHMFSHPLSSSYTLPTRTLAPQHLSGSPHDVLAPYQWAGSLLRAISKAEVLSPFFFSFQVFITPPAMADISAFPKLSASSPFIIEPPAARTIWSELQSEWSLSVTLDTGNMEESCLSPKSRLDQTAPTTLTLYSFLSTMLSNTTDTLPHVHPVQEGRERSPQNFTWIYNILWVSPSHLAFPITQL